MFFDPERPDVPVHDAVDHVVEVADMMSILAGQRLRHVYWLHREQLADASATGRVLTSVVERGIRLELAAALRVSEHTAGSLLGLAQALVERYPSALESLERAGMTEQHAQILATALDEIEPDLRADMLPLAVALAETEPVGTFRRVLRKVIDTERSATLTARHELAVTERRALVEPAHDGMGWVHLLVPMVEAYAVHDRATRIAKVILAQEDETRTLSQIRADVMCDLLIDGENAAHPDTAHGIRATVAVTVPALALLADSDLERAAAGLGPAVMEGVGPIPLRRAKELCGGDGGWMRVLTHPETGVVLSVGRDQYSPPASMKRFVRWRADRCMAPGCGMPAARCEIDHGIAWENGGTTSTDNLCPLCKGHHLVKHHGGWQIEHLPDGEIHWTSPTGRHYRVRPERPMASMRPVFRPSDAGDAPF